MAILIVARIMSGKERVGFRILNSVDRSVKDVHNDNIKKMSNGRFRNFVIHNGSIKMINGSEERYPCIDTAGRFIGGLNPLIVVSACENGKEMIVCDWCGRLYKETIERLVEYAKVNGVANGKVVDNSIRAIEGTYKVASKNEAQKATRGLSSDESNAVSKTPNTHEKETVTITRQMIEEVIRRGIQSSNFQFNNLEPIISEDEEKWIVEGYHSDSLLSQDIAESRLNAQINFLIEYKTHIEVNKHCLHEEVKSELSLVQNSAKAWGEMMILGKLLNKKLRKVDNYIDIDESICEMYDKVKELAGENWDRFWDVSNIRLLDTYLDIDVDKNDRESSLKALVTYSAVYLT